MDAACAEALLAKRERVKAEAVSVFMGTENHTAVAAAKWVRV
jgi:hypothetical protein